MHLIEFCLYQRTFLFDWWCFYYSRKDSLIPLLEALFARIFVDLNSRCAVTLFAGFETWTVCGKRTARARAGIGKQGRALARKFDTCPEHLDIKIQWRFRKSRSLFLVCAQLCTLQAQQDIFYWKGNISEILQIDQLRFFGILHYKFRSRYWSNFDLY